MTIGTPFRSRDELESVHMNILRTFRMLEALKLLAFLLGIAVLIVESGGDGATLMLLPLLGTAIIAGAIWIVPAKNITIGRLLPVVLGTAILEQNL